MLFHMIYALKSDQDSDDVLTAKQIIDKRPECDVAFVDFENED